MRRNELLTQFPTPFYLFDEEGFRGNIARLVEEFRTFWPEYTPAYSFKTNYTPAICAMALEEGCLAEVVSDMEYSLAKKLGCPDEKILYNGPFKGPLSRELFLGGGMLNLDSLDETRRICALAASHPERIFRVGVRINLDLGAGFVSRFGMSVDSRELRDAMEAIAACKNLRLAGLHCHIKAPRDPESWRRRAEVMIAAADRYIDGVPEYFSLGSGMVPGRYDQTAGEWTDFKPSWHDFAEAFFGPFIARYGASAQRPRVFTEPGRALITRYVSLFAKVDSIKEVQDRFLATTDGSFQNMGEMCTMARVPVRVHPGGGETRYFDNLDIMGYTCLEQDVMFPAYAGPLAVGDIVEFPNVGGYSLVYKPQFMIPQCAMYALQADGSVRTLMRAETFDDVFAKFGI